MFINAIAGRILPPRPNAYTGTSTPLYLRILASLPDPLYVLTSGRGIALILVMLLMGACKCKAVPLQQLDVLSSRLLLPVLIGSVVPVVFLLLYEFISALCVPSCVCLCLQVCSTESVIVFLWHSVRWAT
jgi:hypothetical protein